MTDDNEWEWLEDLLDYMEEEYDIERSERVREIGRRVANLRD